MNVLCLDLDSDSNLCEDKSMPEEEQTELSECQGEHIGGAAPEETLALAQQLITLVLVTASTIKCFVGRWQTIRARLDQLKSCLAAVSECPHWTENDLIRDLLPGTADTLTQTRSLAGQCAHGTFAGKLLMQSNLDVAAAKIGIHVRELDVLIKSGVLRQSSAIVLSWPGPGAARDEVAFFVRDLFARLQIGGPEFKRKALESLVQLLADDDDAKNATHAVHVAAESDMSCLVHLLDSTALDVRDLAVASVRAFASTDVCRQGLVSEGALGPLVRLLETGNSSSCKENAAAAIEGLTANSDNAWALAAYGGVSVLIRACREGSPETQSAAVGALKNVSTVEEIRRMMAEDEAVPILIALACAGQRKAIECIHALASQDEKLAALMTANGAVQSLVVALSNPAASQEGVLNALHALSSSFSGCRALVSSAVFLNHLSRVLRSGTATAQQIGASLVSNLGVSHEAKKALGEAGCIPPLVKMLESKPISSQELAAQALASLLCVHSNRREFMKDEKSVPRLVQLLDPATDGVCKKFPISALLSLSASKSCTKRIVMAGACTHLQKLSDLDIPGSRKLLHRVGCNKLRSLFTRKWMHS